MTSKADSVQGGLEVSHLTAITHAVDDQKNRQRRRRRRDKRRPDRTEEPPPGPVDQDTDQTLDDQDDQGPTVDYLA